MEKCNTVCAYSVSLTHLLLKVRWRTCPPHSRPNMCPFKSWRSEILSCYFWSSHTTSWPNSPKHCVSWPLFKYVCIQNPCLSKTSLFRRLWPRRHRLSVRGTEWWWSWLRTVILLYHRCTMNNEEWRNRRIVFWGLETPFPKYIQNIKNLDLWNECVVKGWSSHVQVLTLLQPPVAFVKLFKLCTSQAAKAAQTLMRLEQVG